MFDPIVALIIASCRTYSGFVIAENDTQFDISFNQSQYDATGMNMSFTWLRPNSYYEGNLYVAPHANFDIRLWNYFDLIGQSSQANSSTEMIYHLFSGAMSETYMLGIDTYSGNGYNNRIAYAWSFAAIDNYNRDGLFYLKNVATGYYLQPHVANGLVIQESFSGNLGQLWLMAEAVPETNIYILKNMATNWGYLSYATPSDGYYMVVGSNIPNTLTMFPYRGSAFALTGTIAGQQYVLGMLSDLENATAVWIAIDDYSDLTDYELWYPESRDYHFCDVNMDRTISAADARLILRYAVGLESFTAEQQCLGDANRDDRVNAADARLALRYSVGLYT